MNIRKILFPLMLAACSWLTVSNLIQVFKCPDLTTGQILFNMPKHFVGQWIECPEYNGVKIEAKTEPIADPVYSDSCLVWVDEKKIPKDVCPPYEQYSYLADLYLVDTCKSGGW